MTEWTNPPPPEPVDTYRTPGTQDEPPGPPPPRRCYDCKHARWKDGALPDKDGVTRDLVKRHPNSLRCSFGEPVAEDRVCPLTGETIDSESSHSEMPKCIEKNEAADCADFSTRHKPKPTPPNEPSTDIGMAVEPAPVVRDIPWVPISLGAGVAFGLLLMMFI